MKPVFLSSGHIFAAGVALVIEPLTLEPYANPGITDTMRYSFNIRGMGFVAPVHGEWFSTYLSPLNEKGLTMDEMRLRYQQRSEAVQQIRNDEKAKVEALRREAIELLGVKE